MLFLTRSFMFITLILMLVNVGYYANAFTQQFDKGPTINDPHLKAEVIFRGINFPTNMAFLGPNDILVLEKNEGTVKRIVNGTMLTQPLLHVNVATKLERGMLGIAVARHQNGPTYVFLYYTQSQAKAGEDVSQGKVPLGNRLYRYELVGNKLLNPKLLLNLPAKPSQNLMTGIHNGGKLLIGPDGNVYLVVGDVGGHQTQSQNIVGGPPANGTGGILRVTQDGKVVKGIIGDNFPLNLYYAYGIRNSFGMDFDPITKKLWDTENGPGFGDEVNLVETGFNSGWNKVQGLWKPKSSNPYFAGSIELHPPGLVDFGGRGKYRAPELTWYNTVAPTALKFINSDKLGKQYTNDMFVGDFDNGNLYDFHLNKSRTGLLLDGSFARKIVNNTGELQRITFGHGFGGITDMEVGPDGYLYVLSLYQGGGNCLPPVYKTNCITYSSRVAGTIFRIIPVETK